METIRASPHGRLERQDWLLPKSTRNPTPEEKQAEIDRMDAAATKRARKAEKCRAIQQRLEDRKNGQNAPHQF